MRLYILHCGSMPVARGQVKSGSEIVVALSQRKSRRHEPVGWLVGWLVVDEFVGRNVFSDHNSVSETVTVSSTTMNCAVQWKRDSELNHNELCSAVET
jgi:hypothetical protein